MKKESVDSEIKIFVMVKYEIIIYLKALRYSYTLWIVRIDRNR